MGRLAYSFLLDQGWTMSLHAKKKKKAELKNVFREEKKKSQGVFFKRKS